MQHARTAPRALTVLIGLTHLGAFLVGHAMITREAPKEFSKVQVRFRDDATGDDGGHWMWDDDESECRYGDDADRPKRPIKSALVAKEPRECPSLETAPT